jgi:arylsulfatase A-like enzyme
MEEMRRGGRRTAVFSANALVSPLFGFGRGVDFFYSKTFPVMKRTVVGQASIALGWQVPRLKWIRRSLEALQRLVPMTGGGLAYQGESCEALNSAFLSWLDLDTEASFFAYIHYMETHAPFVPPSPYDVLFDPDYDGEKQTDFPPSVRAMLPFTEGTELAERDLENLVAQYDGSIAYFDHNLGLLLRELESRGADEQTLIVITADHGEEFYDHRSWGHGHSLHEELIRVPLIMWCPKHLRPGQRFEAAVRHVDLMPTMLGAVGTSTAGGPGGLVGRNLWLSLVSGHPQLEDPPVYAECFSGTEHARAIRVQDDKLILTQSRDRESIAVFDLSRDPHERHDRSSEVPHLRNALMSELIAVHEDALARKMQTRQIQMDEGTKETLRTLGYID